MAISRSSSPGLSVPLKAGAYGLTALVLAFEAVVASTILRPNVPDTYRAYYIDKSTTCLDQPVAGTYALGTVVSFRPDGADLAKPLKVCGWEGPAGDGTHAVGTSSRLRFVFQPSGQPLDLTFEAVAVIKDGVAANQPVVVVADGNELGRFQVPPSASESFSVPVPPELAADGRLEVAFRFPQALQMGPSDPDTRWRSIKLLQAGLQIQGE